MGPALRQPMPALSGGLRQGADLPAPVPALLTLRVLGLPTQMATAAIPAVLRDEHAVTAIDLVELGTGTVRFCAVEVIVSASAVARVRARILDALTAVYVENVSDQAEEPARRRTRVCSRRDWPGVSVTGA